MACENDDQKTMNAKYAISIARKLGAVIFLVWEDVLELNQKMMLIFIASLYELHEESAKWVISQVRLNLILINQFKLIN